MCKTVIWLLLMSMILATPQTHELQYRQKRLIVEIEETVIATRDDWNAFLNSSLGYGWAGSDFAESKDWNCYKGSMSISEGEFYEIAGLNEYAMRANSHGRRKQFFTYGGVAISALGLGMLIIDYATKSPGDKIAGTALAYGGIGLGLVGVTFTFYGVRFLPPKLTVASFAVGVADEYNEQLRRTLEEMR